MFNRTVSANLGMSYSISNVCAEAGLDNILRWVPTEIDERELRNRDQEQDDPADDDPADAGSADLRAGRRARGAAAGVRAASRNSPPRLVGAQQQRTVGDIFTQEPAGKRIVDNMTARPARRFRRRAVACPADGADGR